MTQPDLRTTFSLNLRTVRKFLGWGQAELADRAGLAPSAVSHFETGTRLPSLPNLLRLCDALSCTADRLLRAKPARKPKR